MVEIEILDDKKNTLLKRREFKLRINHSQSPTPKKQDLVKELATKYSVPENHIIVDYIFSKKGIQESTASLKIYEEPPKIKVKEKKVEEKPKEKEEEKAKEKVEEKQKEAKNEAQTSEAK